MPKEKLQRQPKTIFRCFLAYLILVLAVVPAQSQQVPIPQNACQVPGPAPGTALWADKAILDGTWTPPNVERLK